MKLAAIYNVFDGEELLEQSINSIKECVDYIIVVYQTTSNFGVFNPDVEDTVINLYKKGLINEYISYKTSPIGPQMNELNKKNIGLEKVKSLGYTHFMTMDCDEFYFKEEFNKAKEFIKTKDIDTSVCWIQNYHKIPEYRVIGLSEPYKVPFINKIYDNTQLVLGGEYFVSQIDPTRIVNTYHNPHLFDKKDILMHHYTTIRKDIRKKYESWTCRLNYKNDGVIDERANKIITYNIDTDEPKCEIVPNYFKIKI